MPERMFCFVVLGGPMPASTNVGPPRSLGVGILPLKVGPEGSGRVLGDARCGRQLGVSDFGMQPQDAVGEFAFGHVFHAATPFFLRIGKKSSFMVMSTRS